MTAEHTPAGRNYGSPVLPSFNTPLNAAVIGASGSIGKALTTALCLLPSIGQVHALARDPASLDLPATATRHKISLTEEQNIAAAAAQIAETGPLHLVFIATGMLHDETAQPEKTWRQLDAAVMTQLFAINTIGPALCAKHFLPLLAKQGKSACCLLSARVGSISDNRLGGWYSYRASKTALNSLIRSMSIELGRKNSQAVIAGLHPGTVASNLSAPYSSGAATVFTPQQAAYHLLAVSDGLTPAVSGSVLAWDGSIIPA